MLSPIFQSYLHLHLQSTTGQLLIFYNVAIILFSWLLYGILRRRTYGRIIVKEKGKQNLYKLKSNNNLKKKVPFCFVDWWQAQLSWNLGCIQSTENWIWNMKIWLLYMFLNPHPWSYISCKFVADLLERFVWLTHLGHIVCFV